MDWNICKYTTSESANDRRFEVRAILTIHVHITVNLHITVGGQ